MIVRELITKLGFSYDKAALNQYDSDIKNFKVSAASVFAAVGALVATATAGTIAMYKLTKQVLDYGDELGRSSKITGIAVSSLHKLRFAANLADVDSQSLNQSLVIFSAKILDAKNGADEAVKSFQSLGIDVKSIKDTNDAFTKVSQRLSEMENGFEKTAIARDFFGRGGGNLVNLFQKQSAEFKKFIDLVNVFGDEPSQKFVDQSDSINDKLQVFDEVLKRVKKTIAFAFYGDIERLIDSFIEWTLANKDFIKSGILTFIAAIRAGFRLLGTTLKITWELAKGLYGAFKLFPELFAAIGIGLALMMPQWLLIAGAIVGVIALLDDFRTWLNGGDSQFGSFYESVANIISAVTNLVKMSWGLLMDNFINPLIESVKFVHSKLKSLFGFDDSASKTINVSTKISEKDALLLNDVARTLSIPNLKTLPTGQGSSGIVGQSRMVNNKIESNPVINVNVTTADPNVDPRKIATEVEKATSAAIKKQNREAFRILIGPESKDRSTL